MPLASALRHEGGKLVGVLSPLERFRANCRFDPETGCVLWTGGTTSGRGNSAPYGSFWYERRRWFAHRWAARHIYGLDIDGRHVDHCCDLHRAGPEPLLPNTLCVRHVQATTLHENLDLKAERQMWLLTAKGVLEPPPGYEPPPPSIPIHEPPAWLGLDRAVNLADDSVPF